ncbi:MAG TPA: hypothetical protein VM406_04405 [Noviherbaspirillum sp.]|nr:hypothetical protein [Noviherbaspirillum sp.]
MSGPPVVVAGSDLMISEVATNYFSDDIAWFEVYNPTGNPISLAAYELRASHIDITTRASSASPARFALPAVTVDPGAYLVIAGRVFNALKANSQMVYVRSENLVPFWTAHGSVELVRNGATVDFVRFGNSTAAPLSANAWRSGPVPALPSGPNEHGKSIVRLLSAAMPDTNTAADWALVNFATPAGPNDVNPGVTDSDGDGIPDSAKRPGGTYAGLDLYAMGARAGRRDIFMEVDYMTGTDPALTPRREALQMMVDAFARRNIGLHIDAGPLYGETTDRAHFNLGGGNAVAFAPCIELATNGTGARAGCTSFYDYKSANFDVRRNLVFHYALFANSQRQDGAAGSSGVAELNGNDLIVTLGGYGFSTSPGPSLNMLVNLQASTLMHELGHNLGLRHGGNEDANYKPNHYSVMNYMYQFAGLSATPNSAHAAERYYLANGMKNKTYCNLVENSPCGSDFRIDFSDGTSTPLDENSLLESANIGRGAVAGAFADWDNNGVLAIQRYARNLNPQEGGARTVLRDYDEWSNLAIPFARGRSGNNYGMAADQETLFATHLTARSEQAERNDKPLRTNPMNHRAQRRIVEDALPYHFQRSLREAQAARAHSWKKKDE